MSDCTINYSFDRITRLVRKPLTSDELEQVTALFKRFLYLIEKEPDNFSSISEKTAALPSLPHFVVLDSENCCQLGQLGIPATHIEKYAHQYFQLRSETSTIKTND